MSHPKHTARRRARFFDGLGQDIRYAGRTLYRYPGFAASVVFTLSLGIGANTAIFSLVDAVLLRMLPVPSPEELYVFGSGDSGGTILSDDVENRDTTRFSYPLYKDLRDHTDVFSGLTAIGSYPISVYVSPEVSSAATGIEQADARLVTGNFFSVLGVQPSMGRTFTDDDDEVPGAQPVVVLSYAYWSKKFGRRPTALGKTLHVNGTVYTIVGVTAPEFLGTVVGVSTDMWVPMTMQAELMREPSRLSSKDAMWLRLIGRLRPGVTEEQASERTTDLFRRLLREEAGSQISPDTDAALSKKAIELSTFARGFSPLRTRYARALSMLSVVVGLVLLIACANVGNLLLARATGRQKEVALRLAVGSSRSRILRQLLTESLILSLMGGLVGILLSQWAVDLLLRMISSREIPLDVHADGRVLLFTLVVSSLAAVLFGLAPALHTARADLNSSLRNQGKVADPRRQSWLLRRILVVSQVAVSLVLLVGAGLFLRTLRNLRGVDTGVRGEDVLVLELDPQGGGYEPEQFPNLYRGLTERVGALPEVRSVSLSFLGLFTGSRWRDGVEVDGFEPQSDGDRVTFGNVVTPGYFETLGISLIAGRTIEWRDREGAPLVAVVNETFARHFYGGESPVGKHFRLEGEDAAIEVIGLVRDIKYDDLREETPRMAYFPVLQKMFPLYSMEVRTGLDPAAVTPRVRQAIRDVAQDLPILEVMTLSDMVDRTLRQEKLLSKLTGFFGFLALVLATVGLYGVMAYGVTQRTNEIGIRMALGAPRRTVVWMIFKDATLMVAVGTVAGIAGAWAGCRAAASLLYGLGGTDWLTILSATAVLAIIASCAGYLPVRRASRMDPLVALRYE